MALREPNLLNRRLALRPPEGRLLTGSMGGSVRHDRDDQGLPESFGNNCRVIVSGGLCPQLFPREGLSDDPSQVFSQPVRTEV